MPSLIATPVKSAPASGPGIAPLRRLAFSALGTTCEVQYMPTGGNERDEQFEVAAVGCVQRFESRYSRFQSDSLVSRINAAAGRHWVHIDPEMEQLLDLCGSIHQLTQGMLDPTVLPLVQVWNWRAASPAVPEESELVGARALVGWDKVQRAPGRILLPLPGMALDFGGFGKEYAVDLVAQLALDHGIANALVDFGHDLRVLGAPADQAAWHIGLEDPRRPGRLCSTLAVRGNAGVAGSGENLGGFQTGGRRYGHIIDPRTGWPVGNGCLQTTIVADTCLQAGVLSTAAFVRGLPGAIDFIQGFPNAEGLIITETVRAQTRCFLKYVAT